MRRLTRAESFRVLRGVPVRLVTGCSETELQTVANLEEPAGEKRR